MNTFVLQLYDKYETLTFIVYHISTIMYIYTEGIDRMTDRYKYINKGLQITRSMDIHNYTSAER